jgi:hypothetical protein
MVTRRATSQNEARTLVDGKRDTLCVTAQFWSTMNREVVPISDRFKLQVPRLVGSRGLQKLLLVEMVSIFPVHISRCLARRLTSGIDDEKEYRHAFLIVEAKKGQGGAHPRSVFLLLFQH